MHGRSCMTTDHLILVESRDGAHRVFTAQVMEWGMIERGFLESTEVRKGGVGWRGGVAGRERERQKSFSTRSETGCGCLVVFGAFPRVTILNMRRTVPEGPLCATTLRLKMRTVDLQRSLHVRSER